MANDTTAPSITSVSYTDNIVTLGDDGFDLKKLKKHIMNKCCKWNLDPAPKKMTDNKIQFKSKIRLVQKGHKIFWDKKKQNEAFRDLDYIAIKL